MGGWPPPGRASGRSGGWHCTAGPYGYVSSGRHLVLSSFLAYRDLWGLIRFLHAIYDEHSDRKQRVARTGPTTLYQNVSRSKNITIIFADRLQSLGLLWFLEERRNRFDLLDFIRMFKGWSRIIFDSMFTLNNVTITRRHAVKITRLLFFLPHLFF